MDYQQSKKDTKLRWFAGLILLVIIFDQASKFWVVKYLPLYSTIEISPIFNLVHWRNYGAAFSFLNIPGGLQRWLLSLLSLIVAIALILWLRRSPNSQTYLRLSLSLIIGGALGNLLGRLFQGYVVDFLDFHWANYHWPAFNVADSAVCVGAGILLVLFLFGRVK